MPRTTSNSPSSTDRCRFSYNVTPEELFDLFGKFGPIRYGSIQHHSDHSLVESTPSTTVLLTILYSQVRQGIANNTKGTAFVVYEDVMDAKQACDKLNGFNFQNRYLVGSSFSSRLHVSLNPTPR